MSNIDFSIKDLMNAGVHYGHHSSRWNPKMSKYIYDTYNHVHIIDLRKTATMMVRALSALEDIVAQNGRVLFVGTKKYIRDEVKECAEKCGQYYVNNRWYGGTLTNWSTVSNSIIQLEFLERKLSGSLEGFVKKEILSMERSKAKLDSALSGIRDIGSVPDAVIVFDMNVDKLAIAEARKLSIPVFAIADTNSNIDLADYPIPGNDDSIKAARLYCDLFVQCVLRGLKRELNNKESQGNNSPKKGPNKPLGGKPAASKDTANATPKAKEDVAPKAKEEAPKAKAKSADTAKSTAAEKKTPTKASGSISADMIKELREISGAGILDCKKALAANDGNVEKSVDWLRLNGLVKAEKKANRSTTEGVVAVSNHASHISVVEVNSETDFVARNDKFHEFIDVLTSNLETHTTLEAVTSTKVGDLSFDDLRKSYVASIGENISVRRVHTIKNPEGGFVSSYVHGAIKDGRGQIGVIASFTGDNKEAARDVCMHIAAAAPMVLSSSDLPSDVVAKEREIQKSLSTSSGKSEEIVNKMIDGKMNKFYKEVCLLDQGFIKDPSLSVADFLKSSKISIVEFAMFKVGDGLEKETVDFATEVDSIVNQ